MKIIIFWEQAESGGVDTHLLELLSYWPEPNDEIHILYNHKNEGYEKIKNKILKLHNVKSHRVNIYSYSAILSYFVSNRWILIIKIILNILKPVLFQISIFQIKKYLLNNFSDIDSLLSDNGGYPASWGSLAAIVAAKKININNRTLLVHHAAQKPNVLLTLFEKKMDKKVLESLTNIIFVSTASKKKFELNRNIKIDENKVNIIHNQFKFSPCESNNYEKNILDKFNPEKKIVIGMIGRIERYKGQEDLIEAISQLPKKYHKKIKVCFVGNGKKFEVNRLKKIIEKYDLAEIFSFCGFIDVPSVKIISNFDVNMMLTRDFEGFGLTILEAIYAKVPSIVTDVGAVTEFIDDEISTIIEPNSPHQIRDKIENYIMDNVSFQKKANLAYDRFISKKYSMPSSYRNVISNRKL